MNLGLGTAAVLWLLSGVFFWGAFVVLGLGFRRPGEHQDTSRPAPDAVQRPTRASSSVPAHVFARTSQH